jgi:phospholipid/cholesterol/gamma-HCH transport system permease protein
VSVTLVRNVGRITLERAQSSIHMASILIQAMRDFLRLSFTNHAVRRVLLRQIYFTSVQALPVIVLSALIIGSITVNALLALLTGLGAYQQIGTLLLASMVNEIAPIACALIMLLRSGTAIISEVALMKINHETDTLNLFGIDLGEYIFLPRILAFIISGPALALCFALIGLVGGFIILGFFHDITFDSYLDQLYLAVDPSHFFILLLKSLLLSLVVVLGCLQKGITVRSSFTEVPIKLIQGMMHTVTLIILIEIVFNFVT